MSSIEGEGTIYAVAGNYAPYVKAIDRRQEGQSKLLPI